MGIVTRNTVQSSCKQALPTAERVRQENPEEDAINLHVGLKNSRVGRMRRLQGTWCSAIKPEDPSSVYIFSLPPSPWLQGRDWGCNPVGSRVLASSTLKTPIGRVAVLSRSSRSSRSVGRHQRPD